MEEKIVKILNEMSEYLSITQMKKLQEVILKVCAEDEADKMEISNTDFLKMFLDAKKIEGCSERTIQYYKVTVEHLLSHIETSVRKITTEEIRTYLAEYQKNNKCSNVTVDNIRRNISSFFSWLEEEDYILQSMEIMISLITLMQHRMACCRRIIPYGGDMRITICLISQKKNCKNFHPRITPLI